MHIIKRGRCVREKALKIELLLSSEKEEEHKDRHRLPLNFGTTVEIIIAVKIQTPCKPV